MMVVIAHMPVYYWMEWMLKGRMAYYPRVTLEFVVCFVVLTYLSHLLLPYLDLKRRREQVLGIIERLLERGRKAERAEAA
jgi:hypothetical protein